MSDRPPANPAAVLCDMCVGEDQKPAQKTCMKCEISMCVQHLQAHLTTPVLLQTHPLTEPVVVGATIKCLQHGKLLEYYCLDDMTCVCVSCAIEDQHRLHNMKTFATAHKELAEALKVDQQTLQNQTGGDKPALKKWEKGQREKVSRSSVRLIEAVTQLRDISLSSVQSSVSARMGSIKTSRSSIEAALKETDAFGFLQVYAQVHQDVQRAKEVDLRPGLEPGSNRDKLVEELKEGRERMAKDGGQFWHDLMALVDPENQHELGGHPSDLTFDPTGLGRGMSLSEDKRKVFYSSWMGELDVYLLRVQSSLPVPNFDRWAMALPKSCNWTVGLCDTNYVAGMMTHGEVFALRWQDEALFSLMTVTTNSDERDMLQAFLLGGVSKKVVQQMVAAPMEKGAQKWTRPQKVEVVRNSADCTLSFFSMTGEHERVHVVSVPISGVQVDLFPFVCLGSEKSQRRTYIQNKVAGFGFGGSPPFGRNPESSNIFRRQYTSNQQGLRQGLKECYCGEVYSQGGQSLANQTCCCGAGLGSGPVTQVLCELLQPTATLPV